MVYRKGELNKSAVDTDWPYHSHRKASSQTRADWGPYQRAGLAGRRRTASRLVSLPLIFAYKASGSRMPSGIPGSEFAFSLQEAEDWL
jgi:hypothetical protein